jgi:hypothetical protein
MPDIGTLVSTMTTNGSVARIARNRLAQFGTRTRRLIGAEVLPAQDVEENMYTDDTVRYRTVVANAGTRYSPVQLKQGVLSGSVDVKVFDTDIGSELTSRDFDALLRYLDRNQDMEATASITNFLDTTVNQALEELREVYRWQAIEKALVQRRGHNGYSEDIPYSNPAGHRAVAAAAWSNSANDPMTDIFNRVQLMADKGFQVSRIISTRKVVGIMGLNDKMRTRAGAITVNVGGGLTVQGGRASLDEINSSLRKEGLPNIELYDLIYRTQTGTGRFISDNVMIFLGMTGRDVTLDLGDNATPVEILPDTLGYTAVGKATGQPQPGRVIQAKFKDDRPPRIEAQGWEAIAPVLIEPEAIATISGIA